MAEIRQELIEQLLEEAGYDKPGDLKGPDGLLKVLTRRLVETAAGGELTEHLGYEKGDPAGRGSGNSRNGTTPKTLLTGHGELAVEIPRIAIRASSPRSWPRARRIGTASTTRSSRCTPAG